jgi:hypothetical protein
VRGGRETSRGPGVVVPTLSRVRTGREERRGVGGSRSEESPFKTLKETKEGEYTPVCHAWCGASFGASPAVLTAALQLGDYATRPEEVERKKNKMRRRRQQRHGTCRIHTQTHIHIHTHRETDICANDGVTHIYVVAPTSSTSSFSNAFMFHCKTNQIFPVGGYLRHLNLSRPQLNKKKAQTRSCLAATHITSRRSQSTHVTPAHHLCTPVQHTAYADTAVPCDC